VSAGRPRSPETDAAIVAATRRLLAEGGYDALSIEAVAREAGVGRPTVYRRHRDKASLVAAAVADTLAAVNPAPPDSGDPADDLRRVLDNLVGALTTTDFGAAITEIVSPSARHPDLAELCRAAVEQRRALMRTVLARAEEAGRLRPPGVETAIDLALGAIYFRLLISGAPLTQRFVADLVDSIVRC
jgi:AcrR family transcriptional regulator